jgi:hypothetical protein
MIRDLERRLFDSPRLRIAVVVVIGAILLVVEPPARKFTSDLSIRPLVNRDVDVVKAWTGGKFPPDCQPEIDDSTNSLTWNCQARPSDLKRFFAENLLSRWELVMNEDSHFEFNRRITGSKHPDVIRMDPCEANHGCFWIEPTDRD